MRPSDPGQGSSAEANREVPRARLAARAASLTSRAVEAQERGASTGPPEPEPARAAAGQGESQVQDKGPGVSRADSRRGRSNPQRLGGDSLRLQCVCGARPRPPVAAADAPARDCTATQASLPPPAGALEVEVPVRGPRGLFRCVPRVPEVAGSRPRRPRVEARRLHGLARPGVPRAAERVGVAVRPVLDHGLGVHSGPTPPSPSFP